MARPKPEEKPVQMPLRVPPALAARLRLFAEIEGIKVNAANIILLDAQLQARGL